MTRRHVLAMIVLVAMLVAVGVPAQQTRRIFLKDGKTMDGIVTKIKEGYQVRSPNGVVVVFSLDQVLKIEDIETSQTELQTRLAKIKPDDAEGLYQLAVWARERGMPVQAAELLAKVLAINPDHENAELILKLLQKELATATAATTTSATTTRPIPGQKQPSMFLTIKDVYRIRLMELREPDPMKALSLGETVSVRFRNDVLKRVVNDRLGPQFERPRGEQGFQGWSSMWKLRYILRWDDDRTGKKYGDDIQITNDPERMKEFRNKIWPIIATGCASTNCHGNVKGAGRLKLFTAPMSDDRVAYTNFYILHSWSRAGARMIDRDLPENSLLLECGLPAEMAKEGRGHPKRLNRWVFKDRSDSKYRQVEEWIRSLRNPLLPPGYRINYKPPAPDKKQE